jgi:hypothetical protein
MTPPPEPRRIGTATDDERAGEVHRNHPLPLLVGGLDHRGCDADAGHVSDQPQPSTLRECLQRRVDRHLVSYVTAEADSLSARRDDSLYGDFDPIRVEVERPDPISISSEAPGRGAPDA